MLNTYLTKARNKREKYLRWELEKKRKDLTKLMEEINIIEEEAKGAQASSNRDFGPGVKADRVVDLNEEFRNQQLNHV